MEFIKHNQLLKIRVSYDQDNGYYFQDFTESEDIEPIGNGRNYDYIKIGNPEAIDCETGEIHPELRDSALEAVYGMDYTDINQ